MTDLIHDLWITFKAVRESRKRTRYHSRRDSDRLARRQAELAVMSNAELLRNSRFFGGPLCLSELHRRRLVP